MNDEVDRPPGMIRKPPSSRGGGWLWLLFRLTAGVAAGLGMAALLSAMLEGRKGSAGGASEVVAPIRPLAALGLEHAATGNTGEKR